MQPAPAAFRIENATPNDIPLILQFIRELAEYEKLLDRVTTTEDHVRETLFGANPAAHALLAYDNGQPVGFAIYFFNYSTFVGRQGLYLEDLFVRPEVRGKGFGRELLAHLASIAVEQGCRRMEWAVLNWNEPAIGFYKRLGAIPMDEWTVFRLMDQALEDLARK